MTDLTATKTEDTNLEEQSTTTTRETETRESDTTIAYFEDPDALADPSTLEADAFGALFAELDAGWDTYVSEIDYVEATSDDLAYVDGETYQATDTFLVDASTSAGAPNIILGDDGGNDWLVGTNGNDDIYGMGGNDVLIGNRGNDRMYGGQGTDSLFGGRGHDTLVGAEGKDYLDGGRGADGLFGGAGNDTLLGKGGADDLYGGGGHDLLAGGGNDDLFDGGSGVDTATFAGASEGVSLSLWLAGPQDSGQGMDTFVDIENVIGSNFHDYIVGDNGGNRLEGLDGSDTLDGGGGNDYLDGGDGDDRLIGGAGNDIFDGGEGSNDLASFSGSAFGVVVDLSLNGAQNTGQGIDSFLGVENVFGSISGDFIRGDAGTNNLWGNDGNDWLWGAGGNDYVEGQNGNDVLHGGAGNDAYYGGDGADAFVYGAPFGDAGDDFIWDYEDGVEKVFVEIGFGISNFSDVTIESNVHGDAVASFGGLFGGSITFADVSPDQIGADDFFFF